jgi:regulatory protein
MSEAIKIIKINQSNGRYFVLLSGREHAIIVSEELFHRHRLKEGIVITTPQLAQLETEAELAECDRVTVRLLANREHSIGELKTKLVRRKFSSNAIQATTKRYIDQGLLDDAHFAQNVAQALIARNPVGRSYLTAYLQKKMVPREIAEETADGLLKGHDEHELAILSLKRRWNSIRQFEVETARNKAYTYLGRRGIGYSAAKAAFEKLWNEEKEAGNY